MNQTRPLLSVADLSLTFGEGLGARSVVDGVSFAIRPGEISALVGQSGSGKTLIAKAVAGLLPPGARRSGGRIEFDGVALEAGVGDRRCHPAISFVFQEPLSSLNPTMRIGQQLSEGLDLTSAAERDKLAEAMLMRVRIDNPAEVLKRYPHEISGGMRQRVMIASALLRQPRLIIADEPTTALDMIVQREILELIKALCVQEHAAMLLITHDLGLVAEVAQSAMVIDQGRIVEAGPTERVIRHPRHRYTQALLQAIPQKAEVGDPPAAAEPVVLEARDIGVSAPGGHLFRKRAPQTILSAVTLSVARGETLALIGESGSGKTTLGRVLAGLTRPNDGDLLIHDDSHRPFQRQFVFQDSSAALNPAHRIDDIIGEGLLQDRSLTPFQRRSLVAETMLAVGLDAGLARRFPHQLSGGQRQRVNIARAVVMRPDLIVADEPLSALDLTTQKRIVELFVQLRRDIGFACILISHDLGIIEQMSDRVAVLYRGVLVEIGPRARVFETPAHPYTRRLMSATTYLEAAQDGSNRLVRRRPQALDLNLRPYQPVRQDEVAGFRSVEVGPGHFVACEA